MTANNIRYNPYPYLIEFYLMIPSRDQDEERSFVEVLEHVQREAVNRCLTECMRREKR